MKKYTAYKTIQLVLLIAGAAFILLRVFSSSDLYRQVATDLSMRTLAIVLWAVLAISFLFVFLDFAFFFGYTKEYRELEFAAHSDPTSGIANRFSCDMILEKYFDKPLPENMGCIMIDITNIRDINSRFGHLQGNMAIRDFSNILHLSSDALCFVGRNGGNKFLALFEETDETSMKLFLDRVSKRVAVHNADSGVPPIEYAYGSAFHEGDKVLEVTQLVSLANSRIKA